MQTQNTPRIDRRYWFGIAFASIFGTNLGDLYAHDSGLGLGGGLLLLIALFAVTYWAEARERHARELYYWLAIIIIRTGATNIGDFLAYRMRIPLLLLVPGLAGVIAGLAWLAAPRSRAGAALGTTNLAYWGAMLGAGVFGTVAGDMCSHHAGQAPAAIGLGLVLVVLLATAKQRAGTLLAVYWCAVALARTAGTCMGDWLAENRMLHLGLPLSTGLTGAAFVTILTVWPGTRREARATA